MQPYVMKFFSDLTWDRLVVFSTNKTDHQDIHEIFLKVVLNTITLTFTLYSILSSFKRFESKPVVKRIFIYDRLRHR
jgi:hypothetical protein